MRSIEADPGSLILGEPGASARAASVRDYLQLLKPRVMSLVVFTGAAGLVAAPGEMHPVLAFAALLAIALGAGGAGALNMWFDADIDARMRRTRTRPVPAGAVAREEALMTGLFVSGLSVILMSLAGGALAAGLLAFSIAFYGGLYTMWLKRRTDQNIVIGGLAGALPPAIAWAAATGGVSLDPAILVALIFLWTPPHFWALALLSRGDYANAGVPMLPVSAGPKITRQQILAYTVVMAPLALVPVLTGLGGALYAGVALVTGAVFVLLSLRVVAARAGDLALEGAARARGDKAARDLFAFSILYLFLVFGALLVEHGLGLYAPTGLAWLR